MERSRHLMMPEPADGKDTHWVATAGMNAVNAGAEAVMINNKWEGDPGGTEG